ncbi:MAG TPA: ABC transporter ATP-binding protein [Anaerolineae bacterium]|nr:ABC transporter ATP-binding protein [Caldilineae bacterium]HID35323.1 ABC transporter ATP-binding protein [Anaerolineae bacterium]
MGFFANLDLEGYDRQYSDRELIQGIGAYFKPHARRIALITLGLIIIAGSNATLPVLVGRGIDMLQAQDDPVLLAILTSAVFLFGVLAWVANWVRRRMTVRTIGDVVLTLRTDAFRASVNHDLSFFDKYASGRIVSRITADTKDFGEVVTLVTEVTAQFIQAGILAAFLIKIEWRLALGVFLFLPILFLAASSLRRLMRTYTRLGMRAMAVVNAKIKESVGGIVVAKNYRQEAAIYREFEEANEASYQVNVRRGFVLSAVFPMLNGLGGLATAGLVYAGGLTVVQGIVTAGAWYLFLTSLDRFFFPVLNLAAFSAQIQAGLSAAERIFALIEAEPNVFQIDHIQPPPLSGDIRFEDVSFAYVEGEKVLDRFNLHIRPGETIALVGHTGAGKSSIARLIARFYEFQEGRLLVDGYDIRTFDLAAYRRQLGIVSQTPFLFSGTVAENIRYANPDISDDAILALAQRIGDGEWLETLPEGLQTQVGERGNRLSMGQRQLVALMRVLAHNPAIFILDEATASIDPFTEWQIQQALNLILARSTSILIAHRLSTVKAADRILVIDHGTIIEEGSHDALMALDGHYATLYNTYFRHQSLDYVEYARELAE